MKTEELKKISEQLIDTFNQAGKESIDLYSKGLKITIKDDKSPVSNGDLRVNELITNKIKELTPNIPIVSEETVDLKVKNTSKIFWLIDPIDGTKEYIAGKDEYTINAALVVNKVPVLGLVGAPKKNRLFFLMFWFTLKKFSSFFEFSILNDYMAISISYPHTKF